MNRGRHKKSKEKEFDTQVEILNTIQKELYALLMIYRDLKTCRMRDYYAKAYISSNDGRIYHFIVAWYINSEYYLNNFIGKVKITLDEATIKNKLYLITFDLGCISKTFKYKHE